MKKLTVFLASLFFLALTGFASAEYIDNGDFTITDTSTNLMWQQLTSSGSWSEATSFCPQSGTGGYNDWRLPTLNELQSLVDLSSPHYIDPIFSCNPYAYYWTSFEQGDSAWTIKGPFTYLRYKKSATSFRCVRGATVPAGCISAGSDLTINLPCVIYNGVQYTITLKYYTDPALPPGMYWKLD